MKKSLVIAVVAMFLASGFMILGCTDNGDSDAISESNVDENVAIYDTDGTEVNRYGGETALIDALKEVTEGQTVKILKSFEGPGIGFFNDGTDIGIQTTDGLVKMSTTVVVIDFDWNVYTISKQAVGSTSTETQGFHLESNLTLTLKKGMLTSTSGSGVKMLVQNYCNLTLSDFTLIGTNLDITSQYAYTLSNNNGNILIQGCTNIIAKDGGFAFDMCHYSIYNDISVTFDDTFTGIIKGTVEYSEASATETTSITLTLNGRGTFTGALSNPQDYPLTEKTIFNIYLNGGFFAGDGWGETGLVGDAYTSVNDVGYPTLASAYFMNEAGSTIKMLKDDADGTCVYIDKSVTIDFDGHSYASATPSMVSDETGTQAFYITSGDSDSGIRVKFTGNGAITGNVRVEKTGTYLDIAGEIAITGTLSTYEAFVVMMSGGEIVLKEDSIVDSLICLNDVNGAILLSDILAGSGGLSISYGSILMKGKFLALSEDSAIIADEEITQAKIAGTIGSGVTLQIKEGSTVTLVDDLMFESGATLENQGELVASEGTTYNVIMKEGSYVSDGTEKEEVTTDTYVKVDEKGAETASYRVSFSNVDHVSGYTYDGETATHCDIQIGDVIDLSRLDAIVEDGYKVTGYKIGDTTYGTDEEVTVDGSCTLTAIVEKEVTPTDDKEDTSTAVVLSVIVALVVLFVFVMILFGDDRRH